jgi:acyl-CoA dehydrogenase family protein 9
VSFEEVRVPVADRLGDVGQGFHIALEVLNSGRLGLAAGSARGARRIMGIALAHARERKQFGKPIGSFEMIQRKFAVIAAEVYAADSAALLAADMVDRGGVDFSLETAACKVFASELAYRAASEAMQIAGGIGYSKEYPYEQALRDSRINLIFEGTNEILRALIALTALQEPGEHLRAAGAAFKDPLHSVAAIGSFIAESVKRTVVTPRFERVHATLEKEAEMVAKIVHDLALAVQVVLVRHGKGIVDKQFLQERMANAAIDMFLATAVLSRTTWEIERAGGVAEADAHIDCARIFVPMACRRARRNVRALRRNQDPRMKRIAERALARGELAPEAPSDE